ncbi:MAG: hypothetical protein K9H64_07470 [Bacteroidales bacterium]|nr:hypothetical protein [Bacteroidales bacterium]MCF8455620.1 hypothetical protein [Bacteroidales bacterium]
MEPYLNELWDEEQLRERVNIGQYAWNMAVVEEFPNDHKCIELRLFILPYSAIFPDKVLWSSLIDRKNRHFSDAHFVIVENVTLIESHGRLSISVTVYPIHETTR